MMQFWIAALALGLVAVAFVLVPVIRGWTRQEGDKSSATLGIGIAAALAIPIVAVLLYSRWTTWDWDGDGSEAMSAAASGDHELDEAVAALERRLAQQPQDLEGWMMLGRSYMFSRRFGDAALAFRQAANIDGHDSAEILSDLGEALALSDPMGLEGEAGALFERALALSPAHPKALWYGGLNAYESAQFELADQRLSLLLTLNPPDTLVPLIEERVAAARAHAGQPGPLQSMPVAPAETPEPGPGATAATMTEPARAAAAPQASEDVPEAADGIRLEVSIDPSLKARLPGPAPMFIIARNSAGGPPLAVIRSSSDQLPLSVVLSDANAMMEGVSIADQAELELIARVSLSGSPAQQPGDLFGTVNYARGNAAPTRITIDRVAQ
jgi:cytochrome c-type biogenesis protein CcmH